MILSPSFHELPEEHLATARGGGVFQKNWVGVCSMLPETISDLIKNLIPHFKPEALEPGM